MAPSRNLLFAASGATAMVFVGGSVAVSAHLTGAPLFTSQALRYLLACLLLVLFARIGGHRLVRPRGAEWLWLLGVTGAGLVLFNVALIEGSKHAEPAVLGVAVACVPLVLALRTGNLRVLLAAVVVTAGALLVEGGGRASALGVLWAVVVFACEAGFTLMAVPLLARHGALGVSVHATWLAAVLFGVIGLGVDGSLSWTGTEIGALLFLAVAVTALAFVCWYTAVARLGAGRAGLLTGIAPVAAAGTGVLLGGAMPSAAVWLGIAVVALGLVVGLSAPSAPEVSVQAVEALPDHERPVRVAGGDQAGLPETV